MLPPRLLGITAGGNLCERVPALLAAGLPAVLLREAELSEALLFVLPDGPQVFVHAALPGAERLAVARGWGLHLPGRMALGPVRERFVGPLSRSCHTRGEADADVAAGADFVLLSPIWSPSSKPEDQRPPLGQSVLMGGTRILALGGISPERARAAVQAGAGGVAVLGGIFASPDPLGALAQYVQMLAL